MGRIKDTKTAFMAGLAQHAWDEGRVVFTPFFNMPMTQPGISSDVEDWALMIEGILSVGWKLHTWQVSADAKGRPQATPLFVRPV
ncbi:hypothetical protein [Gryllotalpicola protaetiae]|uniref:Uncharacterized protein n=1 Tax=Gryllotalpicola protaetiae TaxID=2419771 RepID=A0A387BEG7_9MICO|nr:hypothetical protein [Gryllotalpicola protaetiae]AYG02355.1 hypothetical protein D7I44_01615 [Gryllotalpicola protaetiae]